MQTKNALLFIGKHNLVEWNEDGFEKRGAKSFKVHPEWSPMDTKYDADIALIEMDSGVRYSKYIRPVCLWNGPADITQVVGQNGIGKYLCSFKIVTFLTFGVFKLSDGGKTTKVS